MATKNLQQAYRNLHFTIPPNWWL